MDITSGKRIGFTCSCFDLFHTGHILMLQDARNQCDHLIVGLQRDPTLDKDYRISTDGKNKNKPIQSFVERKIQLESCKYVDEIVEYSTEADLYKLLKELQPNIRILGSDWENKKFTGYDLPIQIHWHQRDHDYSSSNLRRRIFVAEKASRQSQKNSTKK